MRVSFGAMYKAFLAFILRKDNPHGVTAAQADVYTKSEFDVLTRPYFHNAAMPLSLFTVKANTLTDAKVVVEGTATFLSFKITAFSGSYYGVPFNITTEYKRVITGLTGELEICLTVNAGAVAFIVSPRSATNRLPHISVLYSCKVSGDGKTLERAPAPSYVGNWFMLNNRRISSKLEDFTIPALGDEDVFQ